MEETGHESRVGANSAETDVLPAGKLERSGCRGAIRLLTASEGPETTEMRRLCVLRTPALIPL